MDNGAAKLTYSKRPISTTPRAHSNFPGVRGARTSFLLGAGRLGELPESRLAGLRREDRG